jgi:hypothetical protein
MSVGAEKLFYYILFAVVLQTVFLYPKFGENEAMEPVRIFSAQPLVRRGFPLVCKQLISTYIQEVIPVRIVRGTINYHH